MKINSSPRSGGFTLVEITLVISLVFGLTLIFIFGLNAYRKGSWMANCLQQQNKILKESVGFLMNDLDSIDNASTNATVRTSIRNSYNSAVAESQALRCPTPVDRDAFLEQFVGTSDEQEFIGIYGDTFDNFFLKHTGKTTDEFMNYRYGYYSSGIGFGPGSRNNANRLKDNFGILTYMLGGSSYVYVGCHKAFNSQGSEQTGSNRMEFHTNW